MFGYIPGFTRMLAFCRLYFFVTTNNIFIDFLYYVYSLSSISNSNKTYVSRYIVHYRMYLRLINIHAITQLSFQYYLENSICNMHEITMLPGNNRDTSRERVQNANLGHNVLQTSTYTHFGVPFN